MFSADRLSVIFMTISVTFIDVLLEMRVIDNWFVRTSQAMHGTEFENDRYQRARYL
jgi:hypothetical protein